jgi:hypothetical protein
MNHNTGWGYRRIYHRYPWFPLSTIAYTIKKEPERILGVSEPRSGRPKKLTEDDKARVLYVVTEPHVTYEDQWEQKQQ